MNVKPIKKTDLLKLPAASCRESSNVRNASFVCNSPAASCGECARCVIFKQPGLKLSSVIKINLSKPS